MKVALPPLPPAFGVTDDDVLPGGRSMLDLLTEEHHLLAQLCTRLPATAEVLVAALSRHLSAEEQYLYPAARKVLPDGASVADREVAADASLLRTLAEFHGTRPSDEAFGPLAEAVGVFVWFFVVCTDGIFPGLRAGCTEHELIRLGNRVQLALEAAPTRPHPGTPLTPPLNKVVDPALGVVDKVRDVLARRATWPEDVA